MVADERFELSRTLVSKTSGSPSFPFVQSAINIVVAAPGIEPGRPFEQQILSLMCLPIPPCGHNKWMRVGELHPIGQSYQDCISLAKLTRHKISLGV